MTDPEALNKQAAKQVLVEVGIEENEADEMAYYIAQALQQLDAEWTQRDHK